MKITDFHYEVIKNKIHKIFPLMEQGNKGLPSYISSLIYEFDGLRHHLNDKQDSMMQTVISRLEHFYDDSFSPNPNLRLIRSEWLNTINLIDKMKKVE